MIGSPWYFCTDFSSCLSQSQFISERVFPSPVAGQSFFINILQGWFHPLPGVWLSPWLIQLHKQDFIFDRDLCSTPSLVSLPQSDVPTSVQTRWTKIRRIVPPIFKIVLLACVFYFCWWQPPCPSPTQAVIQASCLRVSPSPHLAWLWQSVTRSCGACPCKFFLIFFFPFHPDLSARVLNPGQLFHPVTCSFVYPCKDERRVHTYCCQGIFIWHVRDIPKAQTKRPSSTRELPGALFSVGQCLTLLKTPTQSLLY